MQKRDQSPLPEKLVVALGGNAIHPEGLRGTGQEQFDISSEAARSLTPIMKRVPKLVLTHGNGPGVGKILIRQAIARKRVASMPLDICVANSQGGISYVIMQSLQNAMRNADINDLLILTSVEHVKLHFGTAREQDLHLISLNELKQYWEEGHFLEGSMGPKIQAVITFLENGGKCATIAHLDHAYQALLGKSGTRVVH